MKYFLFIFGISLICGLAYGNFQTEKKYFFMVPGRSKTEITYETYKMYSDRAELTKVENVYNTQAAVLSGLTVLGGLSIALSIFLQVRKRFRQ